MKRTSYWLNSLFIVATTTLAWTPPTIANQTNLGATSDYLQAQSIEIYVPPAEPGNPAINLPPAEPGNPGTCAASIEPAIKSIIGRYSKNWGILAESLADRTTYFSHNADKYFIPASNTKLFTTAAALQRLTPEARIGTKSLQDWITITNRHSNNYYAETLMRYIGGVGVAKSALTQLGINPNSFSLADGSGLSRRNAATPRAIVEILRAMYYAPGHEVFYSSLPVAGISGTLRNRMRQTPAQGMVYAKTGTLTGVRALSGYMNHPQFGLVVFSILVNNSSVAGTTLVKSIDKIVLQLSNVRTCN